MAMIELEKISLTYPIYGANARLLKTTMLNIATGGLLDKEGRSVSVEALKGVSFKLEKGDRLGLVGHNGAGKSTLLKVLASIYAPTGGRLQVSGKINCLFDMMVGMDQELTGYENILLRGLILGLSKKDIRALVPQIETFAGLGDFIKMPVKTYSAGMKVRLAFGIVTSVPSEILLIDEIVSVGDAEFMVKAEERLKGLVHQADILVLSTHDTATLRKLCNKALWLDHGTVKCMGGVDEVLQYKEGWNRSIDSAPVNA